MTKNEKRKSELKKISFDDLLTEVKYFKDRGWEVKEGQKEVLVEVSPTAPVHCVDERIGDGDFYGPKVPGAIYFVMSMITGGGQAGLKEAIDLVKKTNQMPGMHGDDHEGLKGCGFRKLWEQNKLSDLAYKYELPDDLTSVKTLIEEEEGSYIELLGEHTAESLILNLVPGKTVIPEGTAFIADIWYGEKLDVTKEDFLNVLAETVELLSSVRKVEIIR